MVAWYGKIRARYYLCMADVHFPVERSPDAWHALPIAPTGAHDTPVLLYDGDCGFCAGSVQFVLAHEAPGRRAALRFAPLQGDFGATLRLRVPALHGIDSVVWFDPTRQGADAVLVRSDAALAAVAHLGGAWRLFAALGRLVPRAARDAAYDALAARRFALAAPACLLPTQDTRSRFLA